jgi:urea transport system substrate-binding protein
VEEVTVITDPLEARSQQQATRLGLVVPMSGTLGMMGPAVLNCARLAAAELNASGGILHKPIEFVLVDAGRDARTVAADVLDLVRDGAIDAVIGTHASDARVEIVRAIAGAVPYVFTPPYEGGETAPGVYLLGETPDRQLRPVLHWLVDSRRARRWALIGNDYVWPRRLNRAARHYLRKAHADVVAEQYVPLGLTDPQPLVDLVASSRADAVLLTLVGSDLVTFNRAFAASRAGETVLRLCGALEENGLLGAGGDTSGELYASMGYFGTVATDSALGFLERYTHRYGWQAPVLNGHAEACYDGIQLLSALAERAGSLATARVDASSEGTSIVGGRGRLTITKRHADQAVFLARADGLDFDIVRSF